MTIQVDELDDSSKNSDKNSKKSEKEALTPTKTKKKEDEKKSLDISPRTLSAGKDSNGKDKINADLPYFYLFDRVTMPELWDTLVDDINQIYCEVHHIS